MIEWGEFILACIGAASVIGAAVLILIAAFSPVDLDKGR